MEELDEMDWPRLMRALRAGAVDRVEKMLPLFYDGKWKPSATEWEIIRQDDALAADDGDADDGDAVAATRGC